MAIFTRKDIGHKPLGRFIDDQRLARQRSGLQRAQFFEPMLRGLNTIAIDNLDPGPWQPRRTGAAYLLDEGPQHGGTVPHQFRRGVRLHAIEFVIDRDQ